MKEVKSPKKPLLYYYGIVLLIIALFNLLVTPLLNRRSIEEVDYGTFMSKIEAQQIEKVEIDDDEIYYTEKGGKTVYCTGIMDDPGLTERLYASGRDVQPRCAEDDVAAAELLPDVHCAAAAVPGTRPLCGQKARGAGGGKNAMGLR